MSSNTAPLVPGVNDHRRRVPYGRQAGATSLKVPLWTREQGDLVEGRFAVPKRLSYTQPHTNEHYEFLACVKQNWDRWVDWRARRGWDVVLGTRQLSGPYEQPVERTGDESDEELMMFMFLARFRRSSPLYVGLDDYLEMDRMAKVYGVKPTDTPWNPDGHEDTGWHDPLKWVLEHKAALGLKPEDHHVLEWRNEE